MFVSIIALSYVIMFSVLRHSQLKYLALIELKIHPGYFFALAIAPCCASRAKAS